MKNYLVLGVSLILLSVVSCSGDDTFSVDVSDSETKDMTIKYIVSDTYLSKIFKVNVTYADGNGMEVTLNNQSLPWEKEVNVNVPFKATLKAQYVLGNNVQIPDVTVVGEDLSIYSGELRYEWSASIREVDRNGLDRWLKNGATYNLERQFDSIN
ncbi:MAG: hypothetical protein E6772_08315 [Dysgonomonas sp.]|nr:hypothetical protein [Dysgonomonas sp.]